MSNAKLIDAINLNHLRIFEQVYRFKNMTKAAAELHMTQPGVSQQIKSFEEQLGRELFLREKKKLIPTEAANSLFEKCSLGLHVLEQTLWTLSRAGEDLVGNVRIGIPDEFGHHFVMPIVQAFLKKYQKVNIHCTFGLREVLETKVLEGLIDFAIIEDQSDSSRFEMTEFFTEENLLCGHKNYLKNLKVTNTEKFYQSLDYICYSSWRPYVGRWHEHHIGKRINGMNTRAVCQTPTAVLAMIRAGLGVGIVPDHLLKAKKVQDIVVLNGCGKPLSTRLHLIHLRGRSLTKAAFVMKEFTLEKLGS